MRRKAFTPRPGWQQRCEEVGFHFHSVGGEYWDESAAYHFSLAQVEHLEAVIQELHQRCLDTVDWIIANEYFAPFALSPLAADLIRESWRRGDRSLYGRFDFSWNGNGEPKLLEYNADTPTGLIEASVAQWFWLQDVLPRADQFNSLHEKLLAGWKSWAASMQPQADLHFCAMDGHEEDIGNTLYMMDVAHQAGVSVKFLPIEAIGYDSERRGFVDHSGNTIQHCFKLYPWEWLCQDEFAEYLSASNTCFIEPAWKLLLSSKAILPLLWQRHPHHPNLLPASFSPDLGNAYVRKPLYSREGENISLYDGTGALETGGHYGDGRYIYQAFAPLPRFDDRYAVVGGWVINGEAAGLGIREDATLITRNTSRFVPHYID